MRASHLLLPALAAGLAACAIMPASAETRSYNLSGFSEISASSSADVVLKQGPFSITAESTNGGFDELVVEVRGDTLVVARESKDRNWNWGSRVHYTVTVTAPSIDALRASSSADIVASSYAFKNLEVSVSSSGNVKLSGSCADLDVKVSSSGDFRGSDLKCENARVSASSSGDADVYASKSADGRASSSGDVRIHGKPAQFDKSTSSSGSVKLL